MAEAYPLQWPPTRKRTPAHKRQRSQFKTTLARAVGNLMEEIRRLGGRSVVLSTNIELRLDGLPYAGRRQPEDPGVALYFMYKGKQKVFPCDKYDRVMDNVQGIYKTIDALRGIKRWGTGDMMDSAISGFNALPDLSQPEAWREVLGVTGCQDREEARAAYLRLRSIYHPDKPRGNAERFREIQTAWIMAAAELHP